MALPGRATKRIPNAVARAAWCDRLIDGPRGFKAPGRSDGDTRSQGNVVGGGAA